MEFPTTPKSHKIAWLNIPGYKGETVNPIRARDRDGKIGWHCEHSSDGCQQCYAEAIDMRFGLEHGYKKQNRTGGIVTPFLDEKMLSKPLHWKQPRAIFWSDMTDLFGEWVSDEWLDRCFAVMSMTHWHRHILLTKRPERMAGYLGNDISGRMQKIGAAAELPLMLPIDNVWLGATVENQAAADERIPHLLKCPAAVRWLSLEPLLGPVDLRAKCPLFHAPHLRNDRIGWCAVGPETGPRRRPCDPAWILGIVEQSAAAGVPCFVKAFPIVQQSIRPRTQLPRGSRVSKSPAEWPEWAVQQFPEVSCG